MFGVGTFTGGAQESSYFRGLIIYEFGLEPGKTVNKTE